GMRRPVWPSLAAAAALVLIALMPVLLAESPPTAQTDTDLLVSHVLPRNGQEVGGDRFVTVDGEVVVRDGYGGAAGGGGGGSVLIRGTTVLHFDDVTNGLEDNATYGYDNRPIAKLPAKPQGPPAQNPSAGVFFGKNGDEDYRGRTENVFRVAGGNGTAGELKPIPSDRTFFGGTHFGLSETYESALKNNDSLRRDREHNTEQYDAVAEADYRDPRHEPLSTFSIDVDTAAMANVRRFLAAGHLPPAGAVRIEEMINYFSYDYPEPTGDQPFSVTTEVADCPWNPGHRLVHVGVQGKRMLAEEIPARNLVFLLDVSGSMSSPNKLALVKQAMTLLTAQLRDVDRVGIVVYAGASGVVLEPTSGANSQAILGAIDRLSSGGSTNGGAGIQLAYDLAQKFYDAEKINRVILATDGDFNVGTTSRDELVTLIEEKRKTGIFLTVLGVGTGNLKDSQMEMLADKGNGNYAYLDSVAEAQKVLVAEAGGTLVTIAKDVKIQVEFNPDKVGAYRLIGYDNRVLAARDFNDDTKDAGEIGAGHSVTAIYEIAGPEERGNLVDPLKYQKPYVPGDRNYGDEVLTAKLRYKKPDGDKSMLLEYPLKDPGEVSFGAASRDFRFSAAVAAFGMLLKDSRHKGQSSYGMVEELVHSTLGEDPFGYRKGLLDLVTKAKALASRDRD
ncbi:MAG: VWA domain-containing protein, partial [Planctomycetota bacterium]